MPLTVHPGEMSSIRSALWCDGGSRLEIGRFVLGPATTSRRGGLDHRAVTDDQAMHWHVNWDSVRALTSTYSKEIVFSR
jgi:hypothetical protein